MQSSSKILILLLLFLLFFSCSQKKEDYTDLPKITIEIKANHPTDIELFYQLDTIQKFSEERKIKKRLSQANEWQTITFAPDIHQIPQRFRLDFGYDSLVTQVALRKFDFTLDGKTVAFEKDEFHLFFESNKFVQPSKNNVYHLHTIQQKYDPFLITTPYFSQRLKIEY